MEEPVNEPIKNAPVSADKLLSQQEIDKMSNYFSGKLFPVTEVPEKPPLAPETKQPQAEVLDLLRKVGSSPEGAEKKAALEAIGGALVGQATKPYTKIDVSGINVPGQTLTGEVTVDKDK